MPHYFDEFSVVFSYFCSHSNRQLLSYMIPLFFPFFLELFIAKILNDLT